MGRPVDQELRRTWQERLSRQAASGSSVADSQCQSLLRTQTSPRYWPILAAAIIAFWALGCSKSEAPKEHATPLTTHGDRTMSRIDFARLRELEPHLAHIWPQLEAWVASHPEEPFLDFKRLPSDMSSSSVAGFISALRALEEHGMATVRFAVRGPDGAYLPDVYATQRDVPHELMDPVSQRPFRVTIGMIVPVFDIRENSEHNVLPRPIERSSAVSELEAPLAENYHFNLEEWLRKCPLQRKFPEFPGYSGEIITGPIDICNNEHLRRELQGHFDWGEGVPTDVFVMAEGEPIDRHITKIGGKPYRAARQPWPTMKNGEPYAFVAQLNFSESRDLVGKLPGDVVLVFTGVDRGHFDFEEFYFEWQNLGLEDLTDSDGLFDNFTYRPNVPCHGYRCRTVVYPSATLIGDREPVVRGEPVESEYYITQYQATQIGMAPFQVQTLDDSPYIRRVLPGKVIAAINSVHPSRDKPYPFVNRAEPLPMNVEGIQEFPYLMIGDVGCIYISIDNKDNCHGYAAGY